MSFWKKSGEASRATIHALVRGGGLFANVNLISWYVVALGRLARIDDVRNEPWVLVLMAF